MSTLLERSLGCLKGLAAGDAIGKQTETLQPAAINHWYPDGVSGFHGEPLSVIPRYVGRRYEWKVGETTDDTEQTIVIAQALTDRDLSHSRVGKGLMQCRKSNHPDLSLGKFQLRGDPDYVCDAGDGCGAAMRVAPIGIAYSCRDLSQLTEAVFQACIPTHGGQLALCAAAAVAAAVSAAMDGHTHEQILETALMSAELAERFRPPSPAGKMAHALRRMYNELAEARDTLAERLSQPDCFPAGTVVIVPLAIALALVTRSASETILLATNIGGDADSVASMGGAIAGAMFPERINDEWYRIVETVNQHNLCGLAEKLAELRQ